MVQILDSEAIPYRLRDGGAVIDVPSEAVPRARLRLADKGLPKGGSVGYELFDSQDSLGTTNFTQNVTLVRALEGELSRTIRSIEQVQAARVHVVLPKREVFSRDTQSPSASVVLTLRNGKRLDSEQVLAVQHLVASAVPGLTPARISIVDDRGTLLAGGFPDGEGATATVNAKAEQQRTRYQNHLARTIEQLVERTVGYGRVRAEVTADMDFDRINISEEVFDPESQVVRSTQAVEHNSSSREGGGPPPVTVATNLPDADLSAAGGDGGANKETRSEETVNYEISKKVVNHVREAGIVKRLSVAVLVDGTRESGSDGSPVYQPRSQEELNLLATLVRSAIGFDAARGDTIEVVNMRFVDQDLETAQAPAMFMGVAKNDLLSLVQYVVIVVFALLVILLVVRPLLSRVFEAIPTAGGGPLGDLLAPPMETPALAAPDGTALAVVAEPPPDGENLEEMIDLDRVDGRVRASMVRRIGDIVEKHPDEAMAILRGWLQEKA
jgi:flagellar M-ring protein FliF